MAEEAEQTPATPQTPSQAPANEPQTITMTQDQFDRAIKDRLERQRQQYEPKLAGLDELKAKAAKLDELEASRQTEAEKLLSAVDKYKTEAQQAREAEQKAVERANETLVRAAVVREAARARAVDPDDVYALAHAHGLLRDVQIGDDGQVAGVDEAVGQLLADRPHLVGGRPNGGFDGGARQSAPVESSRADLNAQIRRAAGFA